MKMKKKKYRYIYTKIYFWLYKETYGYFLYFIRVNKMLNALSQENIIFLIKIYYNKEFPLY